MSRFSPRSNYERPGARVAPSGPAQPVKPKLRVLFVCVGNAVRSQMAQAFARKYGADIIDAESAGVAPASAVAPLTVKVLLDRGIRIHDQYPKQIAEVGGPFDVVVNISGMRLPAPHQNARTWDVDDPYVKPEAEYVKTANQIESLVMALILELRNQRRADPFSK